MNWQPVIVCLYHTLMSWDDFFCTFPNCITYYSNMSNIHKLYGRYRIRRLKLAPFVLTCHSFCTKKCIFLINARLGSLEREAIHKTIFAKYKYNRLSTEDGDWVWRKCMARYRIRRLKLVPFVLTCHSFCTKKIYFLLTSDQAHKTMFARYKYNWLLIEEGDRVWRKCLLTRGGRTHCGSMRSAFVGTWFLMIVYISYFWWFYFSYLSMLLKMFQSKYNCLSFIIAKILNILWFIKKNIVLQKPSPKPY